MEKIGVRIANLLKEKNISQKDLASMAGVTESALSRYVKNEREPRLEVLANIATALGTTVEYLTTGEKLETNFDEIYRLVSRGTYSLTQEQKIKIIEAVMKIK